jgi:hypothetical protein
MKTIYIRYHHQLLHMVITFLVIVIVFAISSAIFADINYYRAWFTDYLKHSHYRMHKPAIHNEPTDS